MSSHPSASFAAHGLLPPSAVVLPNRASAARAVRWETARWQDYARVQEHSGQCVTVASREDVVRAVDSALAAHARVRAVGGSHSFSRVGVPGERWIDIGALSGFLPHEALREDVDPQRYIRVEAGITVDALNEQLFARGLALPCVPAYGRQTLAGAVSTATHGASLRSGSLADTVVAVEMVVVEMRRGEPRARLVRVEPTVGITSPHGFAQLRHRHGIDLVQDDETFHACVVGLGAVGVVVAYTLAVRESFFLAENRFVVDWEALRPDLAAMADSNEYLDVAVYPHGRKGEPTPCLVTVRRRVGSGPALRRRGDTDLRAARWLGKLGSGLGWLMSRVPMAAERRLYAAFERKASVQRPGGEFIGPSHVVQRTSLGDGVRARASELYVPVDRASEAIDAVLRNARELRKEGLVHSAPISVRFVGASAHHLAPSYARRSCTVETILLTGTRRLGGSGRHVETDTARIFDSVESAVRERVAEARGHWGMILRDPAKDFAVRYPRAGAWARAVRRFDPGGTFGNALTDALLESATASSLRPSGRAP